MLEALQSSLLEGSLPIKPVAIVPTVAATIVDVWTILNRYEPSEEDVVQQAENVGGEASMALLERSSG
jgi:hypothetical protein